MKHLTDLDTRQWQIRAAQERLAQAENDLRVAVAKARHEGTTWEQVGEALGTSRQSAWERFRPQEGSR